MKTIFHKTFIAIFSLFLLANISFASSQHENSNHPPKDAKLLFVLLAKKGSIEQLPEQKNTYRLVLTQVNPKVIYFTDRPLRYTTNATVNKFINEWQHGVFKNDPPNAVMEAISLNQNQKKHSLQTVNYEIELTNPIYHRFTNTLSFTVKPLQGKANKLPKMGESDYVALFIDSCFDCWNGG